MTQRTVTEATELIERYRRSCVASADYDLSEHVAAYGALLDALTTGGASTSD